MSDFEPTVSDGVVDDTDQPGERLDADKVPTELPEKPLASFEHGTTEAEMAEGESLDERLSRERPDDDDATRTPPEDTQPTALQDDADSDGQDRTKDMVTEESIDEPHFDDTARQQHPPGAEEAAVRVEDSDDVSGAVDHQVVRTEDGLDRPTDEDV